VTAVKCPAASRVSDGEFCSVRPHYPLYVRLQTLFSRSAWDHAQTRAVKPAEADLGRGAFPPLSDVRRSVDQTGPQSRGESRPLLLAALGQDCTAAASAHASAKSMLHLSLAHVGLISPLHCSSTKGHPQMVRPRQVPGLLRTEKVSDHSTGSKATATTTTSGLYRPH